MSGANFNPPPGWPIPRGWTPPPEWEPDPSWPSAPAGWQFWIDEPLLAPDEEAWPTHGESAPEVVGPPHLSARRRKLALVAVAVTLAVALTAGTVVAVSWWRESPESVARPLGMLPGTYPTSPQFAWMVAAEELTSGPDPGITSPVYGAAYYASVGAVVAGDHVIVHAVPQRQSPENAQMVAIGLDDGQVAWTRPSNGADGCARDLVRDLLPCRSAAKYGATSAVDFIDIDTGSTRSSASVPFYLNMLATDGEDLYTAGFRESEGLVVAKGSVENPTADWQVSIPGEACEGYGGGDLYALQVRDGIVSGMQGGGADIALRASDGTPIFDSAVSNVSAFDGPVVVAQRCVAGSGSDDWPIEVVDGEGALLFTPDAHIRRHLLDVGAGAPTTLVTIDGEGIDATTGEILWRNRDWPSGWGTSSVVVGDTLVYQGGRTDFLQADDIVTGDSTWGASPAALGEQLVTDGRNLISRLHSDIQARSLADGKELWSIPIPGIGDNETVELQATDHGLLLVTGQKLGLLRPTGPSAPVPGRGASHDIEDSTGGTTLVTKCGTPPRFEPQEIVTETGALVIDMKIVANCPGGDVLSSPRTSVSVAAGDGQNVASGTFDLSTAPIVIAPSGSGEEPSALHRFRFPVGTFWRLPVSVDEVPDADSPQRGRVDLDAKTLRVECQTDGSGVASEQAGSGAESSTAAGPADPQRGDDESASLDALRALANADRPFVTRQLADRWVPQLSSKRPGLVADGIVWNNAETLREHLDLRLRYPEVRLLWSGDWPVFSAPDFWVTIAGVTFADPGGALAWCRDHGFDRDHCYAKLVSTTHPVEGSTAFNN
ncbi:PQQ-like beta-propeller repeat protein [Mycobacterium sp. SMC-4]|uniref:PQQ-like beta-propeller repeat protein n=1 Tax=Mycobacterium sp. SMC-4 TaxID=2857059 RepID=UPI0021B27928|nr:PQQ-like beta-propeller repeat protein [Mycobacterium sp. SMC-4]UXA19113.1 PQQ-like beta-propeller repeat protein [Mycobacterium sp. SMC-4]